jgi:hypothetical protein
MSNWSPDYILAGARGTQRKLLEATLLYDHVDVVAVTARNGIEESLRSQLASLGCATVSILGLSTMEGSGGRATSPNPSHLGA